VASREIGTLDRASLERFQTELIEAGFEPRRGNPRDWVGPIADSLTELTAATTMRIVFVDGWPFRNPKLYVDGLDEWHLSAGGEICLWAPGAASGDWLTIDGFMHRVDEWAERAKQGFRPEDFALDAHLSFGRIHSSAIATVELSSLRLDGKRGEIGVISATWKNDDPVLEIAAGRKGGIEGRWYYVGDVRVPPRNLDAVRSLLAANQRNNFDRRFKAIAKHGQGRLFLVAWDRELGREALVLLAEKHDEEVVAQAIEVAPTDVEILKLRAGPDADTLANKRITVFGLGAVGSNLALRLAEAGVGALILVDGARLRPGDIVRHAAGSWQVGDAKVAAVRFLAHIRAPWTRVVAIEESPWDPDEIAKLLERADLVLDATGFASFANLLSVMCTERSTPLVSAALYRGGSVARVRRQSLPSDTPISDRAQNGRYPVIPPGDEPLVFEPGCSAPVTNASPIAVASLAALAADVTVDSLAGRNLYGDETLDVYRPLADAPFDKFGRLAT
jgi:hypothetical protein